MTNVTKKNMNEMDMTALEDTRNVYLIELEMAGVMKFATQRLMATMEMTAFKLKNKI